MRKYKVQSKVRFWIKIEEFCEVPEKFSNLDQLKWYYQKCFGMVLLFQEGVGKFYSWGYLELSRKIFENQIHGINGFMLNRQNIYF